MNKKKLDMFQKILDERYNALLEDAKKNVEGLTGTNDKYADPTDSATHESSRNFMHRIRDRERKLMLKIKEAMGRIEDGSYGICEICGNNISEARLKARPVTTQCIECKTEMEHIENKE